MKKLIAIIVLVLGITGTTQAQKNNKNHKNDDFTIEQKTELAVKKMTLGLDLTDSQIQQVTPLLRKKIEKNTKMRAKRKAAKEASGDTTAKKLNADKRFEVATKKLDGKIAFKKEMKSILNQAQYEKFEKMAAHKKGKRGQKGKAGNHKNCDKKSCNQKK